jgi:uncharacterized protein (TIGR02147 family)
MLSVYNYTDPVDFIHDYIDLKKSEDDDFSIRNWSGQMGLSSSAPLIDVLQRKKKLKGKVLESLLTELPIDQSEMMYFQVISERSYTKSSDKQLMFDFIMGELRPEKSEQLSYYRSQDADIYSHWIYMAILSMAQLENFELSVENICERLKPHIEETLVKKAIKQLFNLGLLFVDDRGAVMRKYTGHSTVTDVKFKSSYDYIEMVCELAKGALNMNVAEREIQCFSMAMPKDKLPLAKEIIRKARRQLSALSDEGQCDMVYQANMILFPLTKEEKDLSKPSM